MYLHDAFVLFHNAVTCLSVVNFYVIPFRVLISSSSVILHAVTMTYLERWQNEAFQWEGTFHEFQTDGSGAVLKSLKCLAEDIHPPCMKLAEMDNIYQSAGTSVVGV